METQASSTTTTTTTRQQNVIQETTDYSIFNLLPHNRPILQSHVIRLAQSMSDRPHLRPARPVLVNEKYQIIDGQHREKGSELNGQSVFFMVVPGLTIEDARLLNALQHTWGILDYAYSYASSGVQAYVQFVKTYEAHQLPPSIIMDYMMSSTRKQHEFRVGEMQLVDQKVLDQKLDSAEEIVAAFNGKATPYIIASAFLFVQRLEAYNHERMLKKIKENQLIAQSDRVNYIRELERIYNADMMFNGPNYLRFF